MNKDNRLFFPATERNKYAIAKVITSFLPKSGAILEIASGSGEHAVFFQEIFNEITWHTSDPNQKNRESIISWINYKKLQRIMPPPLDLDISKLPWPIYEKLKSIIRGIICINMIHVVPFDYAEKLFSESINFLSSADPIIIYGPFKENGFHTSESNKLFDLSLKRSNSLWGLRDVEKINNIALKFKYESPIRIKMPSNNLMLIYKKR
tara:strand:+ start:222 stop:845 length:624 start_codon:yes stop_codon:yes gene_type:complete